MFSALTFNMQNGETWTGCGDVPGPVDLCRTVGFLRAQDADIIFLQEVEEGLEGGRQIHPPPNFTELERGMAGYSGVFAYPPANPDELPFGIGLAIFCRAGLGGFWSEALEAPDLTFSFEGRRRRPSQRLLIGARTVVGGRRLAVLNTHLQAFFMVGASSDDYPAQRDAIEARLRGCRGPCLLAGDLNCTPREGTLAQFAGAGFRPVQTEAPTWRRQPLALDHILYGGGLRLLSSEVVATDASDHSAVRAVFEFEP